MELDTKCARTLRYMLADRHLPENSIETPEFIAETFSALDLLRFPNTGQKTVQKVRNWLAFHGFTLKDDDKGREIIVQYKKDAFDRGLLAAREVIHREISQQSTEQAIELLDKVSRAIGNVRPENNPSRMEL